MGDEVEFELATIGATLAARTLAANATARDPLRWIFGEPRTTSIEAAAVRLGCPLTRGGENESGVWVAEPDAQDEDGIATWHCPLGGRPNAAAASLVLLRLALSSSRGTAPLDISPARHGDGASLVSAASSDKVELVPTRPLPDVLALGGVGDLANHIDVLKIDIEGAEFDAVPSLLADYVADGRPPCQLLLEYHDRFFVRDVGAASPSEATERFILARGYYLYHREPRVGLERTYVHSSCATEMDIVDVVVSFPTHEQHTRRDRDAARWTTVIVLALLALLVGTVVQSLRHRRRHAARAKRGDRSLHNA
jgi:FkbM family methyltransferase